MSINPLLPTMMSTSMLPFLPPKGAPARPVLGLLGSLLLGAIETTRGGGGSRSTRGGLESLSIQPRRIFNKGTDS